MKNSLHIIIYSQCKKNDGGRETWLSYFLPHVCRRFEFVNVYFLGSKKKSFQNSQLLFSNLSVRNLKLVASNARGFIEWILITFFKLYSNLRESDFILTVGSGPEGVVGLLAKTLFRKGILVVWLRTVLCNELLGRKNRAFVLITKIYESILLRKADLIIANGFDTMQRYKDKYRAVLEKKTMVVIPNALAKPEKYYSISFPRFEIPINVAFVGRGVKERGIEYFLKVAKILENEDQFKFYVVGNLYENFTVDLPGNVSVVGKYDPDALPFILSKIDIALFLLPSKNIHGGGVSHGLLECMASGRLVIAWNNDVVCLNQVLNDRNSILIDEGDVERVVEILKNVLKTPRNLLLKKCKQARVDVSNFSVESHIDRFFDAISALKTK